MVRDVRSVGLVLLLVTALPVCVCARGTTETEEEPIGLTMLVLRPVGAKTPDLSARVSMSISPYLWNDFALRNSRIETSADVGYRESGSVATTTQRVEQFDLERIEVRVILPPEPTGRSQTMHVSFALSSLLAADGSVFAQPGSYALLRAIGESKLTTGRARVVSMSYNGTRGFKAEVQIRQ